MAPSTAHDGNLRRALLLTCCALAILAAPGAGAQVVDSLATNGGTLVNQGLVGVGRLPANLRDKLGETFGSGSGMAFDTTTWRRQGDSYTGSLFLLPDRGFNVTGTTDYSTRVNKLGLTFSPNYGTSGATQQNQIGLTLQDTIPLTEANGTPLSGLDPTSGNSVRPASGSFPALPKAANGKISLDPEAIVRMRDGSFYVSDEYGPYIYRFSSAGKLLSAIRPPDALIPVRNGTQDFSSNNPGAGGSTPVPADPTTGRQNNQGLEGMAVSADGKTLTALLQSATRQDGGTGGNSATRYNTRMIVYDIGSNPDNPALIGHYVVPLPRFQDATGVKVAAQSELVALNSKQFLVLARDSGNGQGVAGATSLYRSIDFIDLSAATNLVGTAFNGTTPVAPNGALVASVTPVSYTQFMSLNNNAQLNRFGLRNGTPNDANNLSEKWEAMGLVPALDKQKPDDFFLFVGNDNDFLTTQGFQVGSAYNAGADVDTMILAYRLTLPTYVDPQAVQSLRETGLPLLRGVGNMAIGMAEANAYSVTSRTASLRGPGGQRQQPFELFASGALDYQSDDTTALNGGARPHSRTAMAGGDVRITEGLIGGVAIGLQRTDSKFKGLGDAKATSYSINPYLAASFGPVYGDLSVSYASIDFDRISRDTGAYGLTARGDTDGHAWSTALNAGYELGSGDWSYGPVGGVRYTRIKVDGYTERDAIHLNGTMQSQTLDGWTWNIGGQVARRFMIDDIAVIPSLRAGYEWNKVEGDSTLSAYLANRPGMSLATVSRSFSDSDRDGARLGAGVMIGFGALTWQLNYDVKLTGDITDHSIITALRYAF